MKRNLLLLLGVVVLGTVPLLIHAGKEGEDVFSGADGQAQDLITELQPDYEPWFSPFWEPPSGEIESMLFALQAAVGAGMLCYCIGYYRGRHIARKERSEDASG